MPDGGALGSGGDLFVTTSGGRGTAGYIQIVRPNGSVEVPFRRECLDRLILVNGRHLRSVLSEYVAHYNQVRPHQSLELWAPDDRRPRSPPGGGGRIVGRPILGGLHHEYERLAA